MKQKKFVNETVSWLDRFITEKDRDPESFPEFVQFVMDTLVDEDKI